MCKICVFAGTTEGRELVDFLTSQGVSVFACVATEYGGQMMPARDNLTVSAKRLSEEEMESLFRTEGFELVVDATHPYASEVTENIARACEACGVEYLRLVRRSGSQAEDAVYCASIDQAVAYLNTREGNILLSTGSKELSKFTGIDRFSDRVYARVLPMEESLRLCENAGLKPSHILAMQGPFSQELNIAMLKSVGAAFFVTKDSGRTGGFQEKVDASHATGATLLVIGRPPQREGLAFSQTVQELCRRFNLTWKLKVTIVGIGPGSREAMTQEAQQAMDGADCLIGAKRMLEHARPGQPVFEAISPEKIREFIQNHREFRNYTVVMSGDTGFFSGTKKLLPSLDFCETKVLPGISSLAYLCAKLGTGYEDVLTLSAHGRNASLIPQIRKNRRVFALLGGENGMGLFCQKLAEAGLGDVVIHAGERLSYPDERITTGTAAELADQRFHSLCAALMENPHPDAVISQGLPDEAFARIDGVPMTKSEVRAVVLSKLQLREDSVAWDIGAGTGSVSIEMALQASAGQVYAIERKADAVEALEQNRRRFCLDNLTIVEGTAPASCAALPAPTHAFLGGTSGNLREILTLLLEKNPNVRIVATAIALETVAELTACRKEFGFRQSEVVCLTAARDKKAGPYHLMTGQNPIYIFTLEGGSVPCIPSVH